MPRRRRFSSPINPLKFDQALTFIPLQIHSNERQRGRKVAMKSTLYSAVVAMVLYAIPAMAQDLLTTLPDWNDEDAAYRDPMRGLTVSPGLFEHIEGGNYSSTQLGYFEEGCCFTNTDLHQDTEGDDLWTAYHMWKRLEGIKPSSTWRNRMNTLKKFYVNDYLSVLTGPGRETDNNYDHVYGWGLCDWYKTEGSKEPDGGAAALAAIDGIIAAMVDWNASYQGGIEPGDSILNNSNGTRRWARQLRLAVCAAEVSPTAFNKAWRDKVIDIVLNSPDFDDNYKMYFYDEGQTTKKGYDYAGGERVTNTFHMGLWMDSMWQAWRTLSAGGDARAATIRERLVGMASFFKNYGPTTDGRIPLLAGINVNTGTRLDTSGSGFGNTDVYTISPVNGLVFAYKFTGDQRYLDAAWSLWLRFQESESGKVATISHYADSQLSSANGYRLLRHNKGELQYVYALFENGGEPTIVSSDIKPPAAPANLQIQ
jgi:hypothetical protein